MFSKIRKLFDNDKTKYELVVPGDIVRQRDDSYGMILREDVEEWCVENEIVVAKVFPSAGMSAGYEGTFLFGPFYVRIYDDTKRMLFKMKWC